MMVRKRTENALAFLPGKIQGATSPKGPAVQARAVFGGALPPRRQFAASAPVVPPGSLTSLHTRPLHGCGCFAGGANSASLADEA